MSSVEKTHLDKYDSKFDHALYKPRFTGRQKLDGLLDKFRAVSGPESVQKRGVQKTFIFWTDRRVSRHLVAHNYLWFVQMEYRSKRINAGSFAVISGLWISLVAIISGRQTR